MDAELVSAWKHLCQLLAPAFTRPTFVTFLHLVTGWVLCQWRPTVTNLVLMVGTKLLGHAAKHWTSYERFFHRAAWSLDDLCRLLLVRVVVPLVDEFGVRGEAGAELPPVDLKIDDTTAARFGPHVAFAGYFKDASASNVMKKVCHWSHNWVAGCITFRCRRWPRWVIGLPVLFALYRKRSSCDKEHPFRSRHQLAVEMLVAVREALPGRRIRVGTDGQYATRVLCGGLDRKGGENLVSRIRRDAAVYALPAANPRRPPGRRGPNRKKGRRLPTPAKMAARRKKGWEQVEVLAYGKMVKKRVLAIVCLWPRVCGYQPIKLLISRDPQGKERDDFLFCTDPAVGNVEIVERLAARWPVEDCIRDGKQYNGFEKVQGWCPRTVQRQAPLAMIVQTLVKCWYIRHAADEPRVQPRGQEACGWIRQPKAHPSYLDMLATLRCVLWKGRIKCNSAFAGTMQRIWKTLHFPLCGAA